MECPKCKSSQVHKNGRLGERQKYRCKNCRYQFIETQYVEKKLISKNDTILITDKHNISDSLKHTLTSSEKNIPQNDIINAAKELLQTIISSEFIESVAFQEILLKIQQVIPPSINFNKGTAILLLDAENLNKFDIQTESFIKNLATYPLQVKIAFANWKNTSGDLELYDRGYQLIHVPVGKNSADAQMIAIGAAICYHYPDAKEVFVCSSDWLLNHLCNQLQNQGLIVHRVRKQDNNLIIENRQTGNIKHYSLSINTEIPSLEGLAKQMETLIKEEHQSITQRIANFSTIASLFKERYTLDINTNRYNESPDFPVSKPEDAPYIDVNDPMETKDISGKNLMESLTNIQSLESLENLLIEMITTMIKESEHNYVSVSNIKARFQTQYQQNIDLILKRFKEKFSLIKFLRSKNQIFKIILVKGEHQVYLVSISEVDLAEINSITDWD